MAHPVVWPRKKMFSPFGNTPPIHLTQGLAPELPANMLLLACEDPRSILYTVYADLAVKRPMDFTCCNPEPAVLARNVLLLSMAADGVAPSTIWCIFYHFFLDQTSYDVLLARCRTLMQVSADLKSWNKSSHGKYLRFCTEHSLAEVRRHWALYLETSNMTIKAKESLQASFISNMKKVQGMNPARCIPRAAGSAASSFGQQSVDAYRNFWTTGLTPSIFTENVLTPHVNPTFAYCSGEQIFDVHPEKDPLLCFFLAPALTRTKGKHLIHTPTTRDFTELPMDQFSSWCLSFKDRITAGALSTFTIRFFVGDPLAFCDALHYCKRLSILRSGCYTLPWGGSQIELVSDDYGPSSSRAAPLTFNVIDTSNLADQVGLLNVLMVTVPLLDKRPWALLHTNILSSSDLVNDLPKSALASEALADIPTLSILLGVAPHPYLSHFTSNSETHEIMTSKIYPEPVLQSLLWKMPSSASPNSPSPDPEPGSLSLTCNTDKLAHFLFSLYLNMFSEEDWAKNSEKDRQDRVAKDLLGHYVRKSLVAFFHLVEDRLEIEWDLVALKFMELVKKDKRLMLGAESYEDLLCYLHLYGLYTAPSMFDFYIKSLRKPGDIFQGWKEVPPVVCIVLKVPRSALKPVEEMDAEEVRTPYLHCETEGAKGRNVHSCVQPIFGDVSVSYIDGREPVVSIREDRRGWRGTSPLIVSFYMPTWLLLSNDPLRFRVGVHLRPTSSNVYELLAKLDGNLTIYDTVLADGEHVQIARVRPDNFGGPEHLQNMLAVSNMAKFLNPMGSGEPKVVLNFDAAGTKIRSMTIRHNISDTRAKRALADGAAVSVQPQSDTTVLVAFGAYNHRLVYPFPMRSKGTKCKIARKSSYIEVEAPVRTSYEDFSDLSLNPFPIARLNNTFNLTNIHYLNLDVLPALEFPMPYEKFRWLNPHLGSSFSRTERDDKDRPNQEDRAVLVNLKESIAALFLDHLGIGNSPVPYDLFGLADPGNGGIHAIIYVNDIKFDLPSHTIIVDACVVPVHATITDKISRTLLGRVYDQVLTIGDEPKAWRMMLPALAERCRTWKHSSKCEYLSRGIPAAMEGLDRSPLCSCGKGKNLGAFGRLKEFEPLHKEATRIAIGPLFAFSFAEVNTVAANHPTSGITSNGARNPGAASTATDRCDNCGGPSRLNLPLHFALLKLQLQALVGRGNREYDTGVEPISSLTFPNLPVTTVAKIVLFGRRHSKEPALTRRVFSMFMGFFTMHSLCFIANTANWNMNALLRCLCLKSRKHTQDVRSGSKKESAPQVVDTTQADVTPARPRAYNWKFIDAKAFINESTLKLREAEDFRQVDFAAISYTWSPNMLEWRKWILSIGGYPQEEKKTYVPTGKPASEDMARFHLFFTVVCFLVLARGKSLFWLDVLCIDQDQDDEKAYFVPKMGSLYASAAETHVYLTGSTFVTMSSKELYSPIWETRAWTLQEYIKSSNAVYCYCFTGDVTQDVNALNDSRMPSRVTEVAAPILARYKSSASNNVYMLETTSKDKVTCYFENDGPFGPQLSMSSYMKTDMFGPDMNKIIGRSTLGKTIYSMKHEGSREQTISMALVLLGGRTSTFPEDMMYSILGLLEMEDFHVQYKIGFEEAKARVFERMKPDVLSMVLGSDWGTSSASQYKDSALPRVINSEPTIGIERIKIKNSSKYTRTIGTEITSRRERFRLWKDLPRRQTENFAVIRAMMGSQTSRLMIMYCASLFDNPEYADIPTSEIPEENIRPVILSGVSRLSDEEYHDKCLNYDTIVDFVEVAECTHHSLLTDPRDQKYMTRTALLVLECDEIAPGSLQNKGTALVLDASALSGQVTVNLIV